MLIPINNTVVGEVFDAEETALLSFLLVDDFGGVTHVGKPSVPIMSGVYLGNQRESMHDDHLGYVVYARQTMVAERYFGELARNIEKYSRTVIANRLKETGYKGEEQILVEIMAVRLL